MAEQTRVLTSSIRASACNAARPAPPRAQRHRGPRTGSSSLRRAASAMSTHAAPSRVSQVTWISRSRGQVGHAGKYIT